MSKEQTLAKRIILEFLDYLRFKIENDRLTMEEVESLAKVLSQNLHLTGTIDDFANFFGKSKNNINVLINRKVFAKPFRRVYYDFGPILKAAPENWLKNYDKVFNNQEDTTMRN